MLVKNIILQDKTKKIVVVSAPGKRDKNDKKVTDLLIESFLNKKNFKQNFKLVKNRFNEIVVKLKLNLNLQSYFLEIEKNYNNFSYDELVSRGEYLMAKILAKLLNFKFVDSKDFIIFNKNGNINLNKSKLLFQKYFKNDYIVVPGFYGSYKNKIKIMSRGGSDLTGAIISNIMSCNKYENYTDVDGVLSIDPKINKNYKIVNELSYKEIRDLSYMGANVLHPDCVKFVKDKNIPIIIKNTFNSCVSGTKIVQTVKSNENIYKLTGQKNYLLIYLEKYNLNGNIAIFEKISKIFKLLNINIKLILTSIDNISIITKKQSYDNVLKLVSYLKNTLKLDAIKIYEDIALMSVTNVKKLNEKLIFEILNNNNINIFLFNKDICSSSLILAINEKDLLLALNELHDKLNK